MRIGPNIDPRGTQRIISSNLLNEEFNFTRCLLFER